MPLLFFSEMLHNTLERNKKGNSKAATEVRKVVVSKKKQQQQQEQRPFKDLWRERITDFFSSVE